MSIHTPQAPLEEWMKVAEKQDKLDHELLKQKFAAMKSSVTVACAELPNVAEYVKWLEVNAQAYHLMRFIAHQAVVGRQVTIKKCSTNGGWWAAHIGRAITVLSVDEHGYWTRDTDRVPGDYRHLQWVDPHDCSAPL